jgi:hypothetical protein
MVNLVQNHDAASVGIGCDPSQQSPNNVTKIVDALPEKSRKRHRAAMVQSL